MSQPNTTGVNSELIGLQVGTSGDPDAYYAAAYGYDSVGRLNHITGPGLPSGAGTSNGGWYAYVSGTDLVSTLTYKDDSANVKGTTTWTYEAGRQIVTQFANVWGTGPGRAFR